MKIVRLDYRKGIKLPRLTSKVDFSDVKQLEEPKFVCIPTKQSKGRIPSTLVTIGESVKIGSVIAKSNQSFIHSSVSGRVVEIAKKPSIYGGVCDNIVIENDFKNEKELLPVIAEKDRNAVTILKRIFEAGIVDADGKPLFAKFLLEPKDKINCLVINCCTDEPFFTNNIVVMNNYFDKIINGAKYLASVLNTKMIKFVVLKKIMKQIKPFLSRVTELFPSKNIKKTNDYFFEINSVPSLYPVGDECELVSALTYKEMKYEQNPKDFGLVIVDVYTLLSVTNAIELGEKETDKIITIVGADNNASINIKAKIGTYFEDIRKQVRNNSGLPVEKIVAGGPMRGIAVSDFEKSTTKCMKGIVFLTEKNVDKGKEIACTNCGLCTAVCPRNLAPEEIERCVMANDFITAKRLGVEYCTKCGCCSYVCPSKRNILQRLNYARTTIKEKGV